jgi:hypothetical protein
MAFEYLKSPWIIFTKKFEGGFRYNWGKKGVSQKTYF